MTQLVRKTEDEAGALARLGFEELRGFTESIGTMERDIAGRAFGYVPLGQAHPVRARRRRQRRRRALGRRRRPRAAAPETPVGRRPRPERPLSATPPAASASRSLNGLVGDRLERDEQPARSSRSRCASTACRSCRSAPRWREAFPQATPRLVVFLHGLMETERGWRLGARQGREDYGTRLARDLGVTPVYVRYNSGRHISENGRSLADLLERVVAEWPVAGRGGRARRPLDGRARLPQRRAPRRAGGRWRGSSTSARWSRSARRTWARRSSRPSTRGVRRSAGCRRRACSAPSCAAAARASATSARARWSTRTGASATPRRCAPRRARRCRCSRAQRTASSRRPSRAARATRSAAWSATRSCWRRARRAASRTRKLGFEDEFGLHVGAPTTSRCSTIRRSTRSFRRGWR